MKINRRNFIKWTGIGFMAGAAGGMPFDGEEVPLKALVPKETSGDLIIKSNKFNNNFYTITVEGMNENLDKIFARFDTPFNDSSIKLGGTFKTINKIYITGVQTDGIYIQNDVFSYEGIHARAGDTIII